MTEREILERLKFESRSAEQDKNYYCVAPSLFLRKRGIYQAGEFYGGVAKRANDISAVFQEYRIKVNFLIEPTLHHLNRHFNDLDEAAKEELKTGENCSPSWVPALLSLYDNMPNASITVWDLRSVELWKGKLLSSMCAETSVNSMEKLIKEKTVKDVNFQFDRARDIERFELDLDMIDSLPEFNLVE